MMVTPNQPALAGALPEQPLAEQLGDELTLTAATLHAALRRAIARRGEDGANAISQQQVQTIFALEVALRQQANTLYARAAGSVLAVLAGEQQQLQSLLLTVRRTMERHDDARLWIGVATGVLNLGSAVLSGNPERILTQLARLRERLP